MDEEMIEGAVSVGYEPPSVMFRGKKRKIYRRRVDGEDEAPQIPATEHARQDPIASETTETEVDRISVPSDELAGEGLSVADLIRRRNARRSRFCGVTFGVDNIASNQSRGGGGSEDFDDELSQMIREEENRALDISAAGVNRRFAHQTGLAGEIVNKHMEEYIEAELEKRHLKATPSSLPSSSSGAHHRHQKASSTASAFYRSSKPSFSPSERVLPTAPVPAPSGGPEDSSDKPPALQGKLFEIDLGDDARSRNEKMTDRAWRKLKGESVDEEEEEEDGGKGRKGGRPPKKIRLGRDGKPWRPRNRRGSDDIKRDQVVEEILRETKLDVYDTAATSTPPILNADQDEAAAAAAADEAADARIAEEFRREFMEAMQERRQRRRPAINAPKQPANKARKSEDQLKGPKLGGSRNERAAYRDKMLKESKEEKKK